MAVSEEELRKIAERYLAQRAKQRERYKERWAKIKASPELYAKAKEYRRAYYERRRKLLALAAEKGLIPYKPRKPIE
jgi:hypothetical protein